MSRIKKMLDKTHYDNVLNMDVRSLDITRLVLMVLLVVALFAPDWQSLMIVKYVAGFLMAVALLTHLLRKLMFPYVDLRKYTTKALEHPVGSGMVILGMCLIISVTIFSVAQFFK